MARHPARRSISWPRRSARRDEGAALVETAIIIWTLLLIAFGIVDFGLMFRHYYSLAGAVRTGARTGAIASNDVNADWQIMQSVLNSRGTISNGRITKIVVFKADAADGRIPESCKTAPASNCNVFTASHFAMDEAAFLGSGAASFWPASGRQASALTDTDFLGVWVETQFDYATGIFGSHKTIADTAVMRLDPKRGHFGTTGSTLAAPSTTTTTAPTTTTTGPATTTTTGPSTTTTAGSTTTTKKPKKPKKTTTTTAAPATTTTPTTRATTTTTAPTTTTTTFQRGGG